MSSFTEMPLGNLLVLLVCVIGFMLVALLGFWFKKKARNQIMAVEGSKNRHNKSAASGAVKCTCCTTVVLPVHPDAPPNAGWLSADWGYGAQHDGERVSIPLCESCFYTIIEAHQLEKK